MLYDKDWAKEIIKQWSEDSETPDNVKKAMRTKEQGMTYMGTSSSSNGPGSGVSLDPPWLDDIEIPNIIKQPSSDKTGIPLILAPKSRFGNARRNMGEYVRSEAEILLRKALGHYSKSGMGGLGSYLKECGHLPRLLQIS